MSESETVTVEPWDREFNTAIVHLTGKLLPRSYVVIEPDQEIPESWEFFEKEGQPVLRLKPETETVFADREVEGMFRALFAHGTLRKESSEKHRHHYPWPCPEMIKKGVEFINAAIVDAYGDDERTQRWRKAVVALTFGAMGFFATYGQCANPRVLVEGCLKEYSTRTTEQLLDDSVRLFLQAVARMVASWDFLNEDGEPAEERSLTGHVGSKAVN
jgi:hypothetical protein